LVNENRCLSHPAPAPRDLGQVEFVTWQIIVCRNSATEECVLRHSVCHIVVANVVTARRFMHVPGAVSAKWPQTSCCIIWRCSSGTRVARGSRSLGRTRRTDARTPNYPILKSALRSSHGVSAGKKLKATLTDVSTGPLPEDDNRGDPEAVADVELEAPLPYAHPPHRGPFWHHEDSLHSAEGIINSAGISLILWALLLLWMIC
jgi:hypothetical protein